MTVHRMLWSRGSRNAIFPDIIIPAMYNKSAKDEPLVVSISYLGQTNGNRGAALDGVIPDIIDALKRGGFTVQPMDEDAIPEEDDGNKYKIVRQYAPGKGKRTIKTGLTLSEAKAHCSDPNTCSKTGTSPHARRVTKKHGYWADTFTKQ